MLMARRHRRSGVERKTASLDKAAARMQTPALRKLDAKVKWR